MFFVIHQSEKMMDDLSQMRLTRQIIPLETTLEHGFVLFKVSFIKCLFSLNISDFFDLIVIDDNHFVIEDLLVQVLFCIHRTVWFLEADESKTQSLLCLLETDIFNLTKLTE